MRIYANDELTWDELLRLPVNSVFYELDITSEPIYIKCGDCCGKYEGKDIKVMTLQPGAGVCRMGFFEMDEGRRNSLRYHVLSEDEINTMIGRLMLANPSEVAK